MPDFDHSVINGEATPWLRPRTTRRYLHPPKADRMFVLWTEGKVLFGENVLGEDFRYYKTIESCALWPAYSKYDRQFDFRRAHLTTTQSGAPIHGLTYQIGGFRVEEEAFCDTAKHPTCFIRFRLHNTVPYEISNRFAFFLRRGLENDIVYGGSDGYASYLPEIAAFKALPVTFSCENGVARCGEYFVTADTSLPLAYDEEAGAFRVEVILPPGGSAEVVLSFGKGKPRPFSYEEERAAAESFWETQLARMDRLPEDMKSEVETFKQIRHLTAQMLQCFCYHTGSDRLVLRQGGLQRLIWPWDAMPALEALGRTGDFSSELEAVFHTYFDEMQQPSGEIQNFGESWASVTACCLYSFATYCLQKGDANYWRRYREKVLRAFGWVEQQRRTSETIPGAVAGLMPPLRGSDWQEVFQHWTFTDCLTISAYRALVRAADAFFDPAAQELRTAYDGYRKLVLHILESVPGFEGTEPFRIPLLPRRDDRPLLDQFYPYLFHMLPVLQLHDLLPESVFERVRAWAERVGLVENGLHNRMPGQDGNTHIFYTTASDYDWFFLYMLYGHRREAEEIVASTVRYSMTEEYYMIERYDSTDPYFVPWSPNVSASGRLINMMLDLRGEKTNCY